jgi:hypothetical protein
MPHQIGDGARNQKQIRHMLSGPDHGRWIVGTCSEGT